MDRQRFLWGALASTVLSSCMCGGRGGPPADSDSPRGRCTEPAEGCACQADAPEPCFDPDPRLGEGGTPGTGLCAAGTRYCLDGTWGACEGQVLPRGEICGDGLDNDCDAQVDEGRRCDCQEGCVVEDDGCFANGQAVDLALSECTLVLATEESTSGYAWIANTRDSTLSRIDTTAAVEIARYSTVNDGPHGAPGPEIGCDESQADANAPTGNCPSRTAVAANGDAFVANRAFGSQGTVTRIASELDRCVDRNRDGVIQTSQDLDGDGAISTDPIDGELLGVRDECIVWTVPVGGPAAVPRALAIAPSHDPGGLGDVWVGLFFERRALLLDPETGDELENLALDIMPYGAAASSDGRIWFTETDWHSLFGLQAVHADLHFVENAIEPPAFEGCSGSYGIAIDEQGRVWRGSSPCAGVFRYDPDTVEWAHFTVDDTGESLGVASDGEGRIWAAFFRNADRQRIARVARLDGETGEADRFYDLDGLVGDVWGVDIDAEGDAWVVSRESDQTIQIDPETGEMTAIQVGDEPYTYSDFTGQQLRIATDPTGRFEQIFVGCADGPTRWFDVEVEAEVPVGSLVKVSTRSADDLPALALQTWTETYDRDVDLSDRTGRYLQVRIDLWSSDDGWTPILRSLSVAHLCVGPVE